MTERSLYVRDPGGPAVDRPLPSGYTLRPVAADDDQALGRLMERAYAGTIDEDLGDNNDGAVEIADWRATGAVPAASVVALEAEGSLRSASLVSHGENDDTLWIGYVISDPGTKRVGLATAVVAASLTALHASDAHAVVSAGVTDGNVPSEKLLARLGFRRVGSL